MTPITLALTAGESWRNARTALAAMLSRGALNPADISVLFRAYTQPEPPPVHLLRIPQFLGTNLFSLAIATACIKILVSFISSQHSKNICLFSVSL